MDANDREKLDRTYELVVENNKLLRKMRGVQKTNQTMRLIYWIFIIFSMLGAYYFVQPYLGTLTSVYSGKGLPDTSSGGTSTSSPTDQLQSVLDLLK